MMPHDEGRLLPGTSEREPAVQMHTIEPETRRRPGLGAVAATVGYLWLMSGFAAGTALLVGPARWVPVAVRRAGLGEGAENHAMRGVILAFIIGSFFLALALAAGTVRARGRGMRFGIPMVATALAALALWGWSDPGRMLAAAAGTADTGDGRGEVRTRGGATFAFGAYPNAERLAALKKEGYTAVVSLQHPAVVPFEPRSIAEERRNAARVGLTFIHAPMLPWVSSNGESLAKIRGLVRTGHGKYYVHCGLGRDRTNVVKRMVEHAGVDVVATEDLRRASTFAERVRGPAARRDFQRGALRELEPGVWLVPYPNSSEMAGYFQAGQMRSIVFILNPSNARDAEFLGEGRRILTEWHLPFVEIPTDGTKKSARAAAERVRALPRPVAVIAARTPYSDDNSFPGTEVADAFMAAYPAPRTPAAPH